MPTKPELIDVDPASLLIGTNVRRDAHADTLVSSLKSNGMLHPIRARRTDDGLEVIDGQRRTLAAITAGLQTVPVLVVGATDQGRIFEQYVSNEHREALTDADRVHTVKQLTLFGLNAGTIAKRTGLTKTVVEKAAAITDTTLELAPAGSFEDLADLAAIEGEPEHEEAAARLAGGDTGYFRSLISQCRRRLAAETETDRIRTQHPDVVLLSTAPSYGDKQYLQMTGYDAPRLEREDGTPIPALRRGYNEPPATLEEAIEILGDALAVYVMARSGYGDSLTETHFYVDVKQMKAAGLRKAKAASAGVVKSPEEIAQDKAAKLTAQAWAETADDRKTFLARLMQEKQPPSGWAEYVTATAFGREGLSLGYGAVKQQATQQILGLDHLDIGGDENTDLRDVLRAEVLKRPDRLPFALIALALVAVEEGEPQGLWKPFSTHGHLSSETPAYLDQLEKWGYNASVERSVLAEVQA